MLIECKGGETYSSDYIKNLQRFPENQSQRIEKILIYAGENSMRVKDISLKSIKELPGLIKEL